MESKLGFGTMRLPLTDPDDPASIDIEQFKEMVDIYMDRDFKYFDTAYPYHSEKSEEAVRRALVERYPRDSFILADKMPILRVKSSDDYQKYFDEQLRRCGTDHFDYYLLHNLGRDRYINTTRFGGFEFIADLREKGCVGKIGFSFHDDADTLDRILTEHPEVDFVQLQINYLDWEDAVAQSGRCYEVACRHDKDVFVMEPVKGGLLAKLPEEADKLFTDYYRSFQTAETSGGEMGEETGVYSGPSPASLAIRYAASLDRVKVVLSGMSSLAQLKDNVSYMKDFTPLTDGEKELVTQITRILRSSIKIPCTGCRYCTEECPKNINIPDYFGLLNLYAVTGKKTQMYFERFAMNHGRASDCIKCGRCEAACPQHIAIREYLTEFADLYEQANC